ncbi:calcium-independent phospholipase A2-gamma-like [Haliotis rufescens]|uniref:calcium-independent phospholipase A2-gamma-like n=1 Tax=Haliotis rufescens TaxID=6454 RepID=UPI001EB08144|nr:calcium-independent phospholipase A2-gamma-like [Haliotis rufescens]
MASLRNSASACVRLLTPPPGQVSASGRWRTASPDRWRRGNDTLCGCQEMSTMQQIYHNHTDSKNGDQKDENHKKETKTKSYMDSLKEQIKYLEKVKDNIASSLSNVGLMNAVVPTRFADEFQKYVPFPTKLREKVEKDLQESIEEQKAQLKNLEKRVKHKMMAHELKDPVTKEQQSFERAMQDTNESIVKFYDTLDTTDPNSLNKPGVKAKTVNEDDLMTSIFKNVWPVNKAVKDPDDSSSVVKKKPLVQRDFVSKTAIDSRTRALVEGIKTASTLQSKLRRTEDFCRHILQYPNARFTATKDKVVPYLLKFRGSQDEALSCQANQALVQIGYVDPVKGQGIRMLTIDGGGTRGLLAIECLKKLEEACQTDIRDMFDYVCGVSTGALVAAMVFLYRVPLDECEILYKDFSQQMFTRNRVLGTSKLVWSHAFYDTEAWENILKKELGEQMMIEFAKDKQLPKYSGMSTLMNVPKLKNFIFRNYNLPPQSYSRYPGGCRHSIWEVIRASSAAPGYFEEFKHGDYVHQDGGLMTNNPTAIAIHEGRLLWPNESIQCVISIGTGRYEPAMELLSSKLALKDKVMKIVDSATDTEAVHSILHDLLPQNTYYRFNPYLSEYFLLDEIRPEKIDQMMQETQLYLRKNDVKITKAINQLSKPRRPHQRAADLIRKTADSVRA